MTHVPPIHTTMYKLHCESKNQAITLLTHLYRTLANFQFFHWQMQEEICNKLIIREHWIQSITFAAKTNAADTHTAQQCHCNKQILSDTIPSPLTQWQRR